MVSSATSSTSEAHPAQGESHVLLTGFEPFGGSGHNSAADVVSEIALRAAAGELLTQQEHDDAVDVSALTLPVKFDAAGHLLTTALEQQRPDVGICV